MEQLSFDDLQGERNAERWLPVVGYEGMYEVSDLGRVRGLDRIDRYGRLHPGHVLYPFTAGRYATIKLYCGGSPGGRSHYVHQLVLEAFVGQKPAGQLCRHGPNGPQDNSLANLCYGTPEENMADKIRDETETLGERHGRAVLKAEQVREIRALYAAQAGSQHQIGLRFGVSGSAVGLIVRREKWRHVA